MIRFMILQVSAAIVLHAAQPEADSLQKVLDNHPLPDSTRLNLLNELAYRHYPYSDPQRGVALADEAISLATNLAHASKLGYAYRAKGINFWAQGKYPDALEMYGNAIKHYDEAEDEEGKADAFNNIGVVYLSLANYPRSLEHYLRAQPIYERIKSKKLANILTNIGLIHKNMAEPRKALEFFQRGVILYEESQNLRGLAQSYANIGNVYDDLDSMAQAVFYHHKALALNDSLQIKKGSANSLNSLGIIYNKAGNHELALRYLERSLRLYEEMSDKNALIVALVELGKVYRSAPTSLLTEWGIPLSRRNERALVYQRRALGLAHEIGSPSRQAFALEELSRTFENAGNYEKALDAFKQSVVLRDSVDNDRNRRTIATKTMEYEFEKREALLNAEHEAREAIAAERLRQKQVEQNSVMGGATLLLLGAVTSFLFYKKRTDADKHRQEAEFRTQVAETEMKALRLQINPHFIFNCLNSISNYIATHDTGNADYYLTKFAKLMRMILEHSEQKEVALADDLQALELYMQLERMRLNNMFTYEIHVDQKIDPGTTLVPPMLLQPFVENSIWHGIAPKQSEGMINIRISEHEGMIRCTVEDNGIGRKTSPAATSARRQSFGFKITKARIEILNRTKQVKANVELSDLEVGTRVDVTLPFARN